MKRCAGCQQRHPELVEGKCDPCRLGLASCTSTVSYDGGRPRIQCWRERGHAGDHRGYHIWDDGDAERSEVYHWSRIIEPEEADA